MVNENVKPYDPNFSSDTTNLSLYLTFDVENGAINPVPKSAQIVPVKMAIPLENGTFRVRAYDGNQKTLVNYAMESPLTIRSCDDEGTVHITTIQKGEISLSLPYSSGLTVLELDDPDNREQKPVRVDLSATLKRLLDKG